MTFSMIATGDPAGMTRAEALAELARLGLPPISGGSGEGDGDGGDGSDGENADQGSDELTRLRAALDKIKGERDSAAKELKTIKTELDGLKSKDQTELERAKSELAKLQEQLTSTAAKARERAARSAVIDEATRAGALKPDVIYRLVKDQVDHDDDGEVTNAAALIKQAKKDTPELFRAEKGGGGNAGAKDETGGESNAFGLARLRNAYAESSKRG